MKTALATFLALIIPSLAATAADMPVRKPAGEQAGPVERKKPKAEGNEKLFMDFLRWQKGKQQPRQ